MHPDHRYNGRHNGRQQDHQHDPGIARPTVVFHDGGCPLCRREIAHYQRLDARHGARIDWRDIHRDPQALEPWGLNWHAAMQRMHVIDPHDRVQTGAWAFVALWRALPYYRVVGRILARMPWLVRGMDRAYRVFARRRWKRRCADGACDIPLAPAASAAPPSPPTNERRNRREPG